MKTFKEQYKRLPGRSKPMSFLVRQGRQHLYLAEDHILVVNPGTYSEESYRIALGDIQAVTINKTIAWIVYGGLTGIPLIVILAVAFFMEYFVIYNQYSVYELLISFAVYIPIYTPFLVILAMNLSRGPTCKCVLRTAVKQHHLSSLGRMRTAKKAIAMIAQAAYAQQGNFAAMEEEEQTTNEHE